MLLIAKVKFEVDLRQHNQGSFFQCLVLYI